MNILQKCYKLIVTMETKSESRKDIDIEQCQHESQDTCNQNTCPSREECTKSEGSQTNIMKAEAVVGAVEIADNPEAEDVAKSPTMLNRTSLHNPDGAEAQNAATLKHYLLHGCGAKILVTVD